MERISIDQVLTYRYDCDYCGRPGIEARVMGTGGRRGAWRRYHPECSRAAKRANDRELARRRYRRLKGLCEECGRPADPWCDQCFS